MAAKKPEEKNQEVMLALGEELVSVIQRLDVSLIADGPVNVTIKLRDGGFRHKDVQAMSEFFVESSYVGLRGNLIVQFSSLDLPEEWLGIELEPSKIDVVFPMLLGALDTHFGTDSASMVHLINHLYARRVVQVSMEKEDSQAALRALPNFGRF